MFFSLTQKNGLLIPRLKLTPNKQLNATDINNRVHECNIIFHKATTKCFYHNLNTRSSVGCTHVYYTRLLGVHTGPCGTTRAKDQSHTCRSQVPKSHEMEKQTTKKLKDTYSVERITTREKERGMGGGGKKRQWLFFYSILHMLNGKKACQEIMIVIISIIVY